MSSPFTNRTEEPAYTIDVFADREDVAKVTTPQGGQLVPIHALIVAAANMTGAKWKYIERPMLLEKGRDNG